LLTTAGFHVPIIELVDVNGNIGLVEPEHIGVIAVKLAATIELTDTFNVNLVAH
jgi:hypothetical protein